MDPNLKQKWIAALRSGRYRQGQGRLRSKDNCFCCLGVLCDLVDSAGWIDDHLDSTCYTYQYNEDFHNRVLPKNMLRDMGTLSDHHNPLIALNDQGSSFTEIANYIEENL